MCCSTKFVTVSQRALYLYETANVLCDVRACLDSAMLWVCLCWQQTLLAALADWMRVAAADGRVCVLLQALCAEASLAALRRVYPQIYASDVKLLIDTSAVRVTRQDFVTAMQGEDGVSGWGLELVRGSGLH
jgi:hypothetical protein